MSDDPLKSTLSLSDAATVHPRRRRRGFQSPPALTRVTAELGAEESVTISGTDLDLRRVITLLSDTLSKARKAQTQQMSLTTFVSLLRDQAALLRHSPPAK